MNVVPFLKEKIMASETSMLRTTATYWAGESTFKRLHRCAVQLHNAGVMADYELEKVQGRIKTLLEKKIINREHMETL